MSRELRIQMWSLKPCSRFEKASLLGSKLSTCLTCLYLFFTNCAGKRFLPPCTHSPPPRPPQEWEFLDTFLLLYRRALPVKQFCLASKIRTHLHRQTRNGRLRSGNRIGPGEVRSVGRALSPGSSFLCAPQLPFCT